MDSFLELLLQEIVEEAIFFDKNLDLSLKANMMPQKLTLIIRMNFQNERFKIYFLLW